MRVPFPSRWLHSVALAVAISSASSLAVPEETVSFDTQDGVRVAGVWYSPARSPAAAVLLLHRLGGSRSDWNPLPQRLQQEGYAVLAIDLRGHGESTRKGNQSLNASTMSDSELKDTAYDLQAALDFLRARPEVNPGRIGLIGADLGANHALRCAAYDDAVRSVILLSPASDERSVTLRDAITRYGERPVMIVASLDDRSSADVSRALEERAVGKKKLKLYDRAGHGTDMLAKAPDLLTLIVDWLDETL